MMLRLGYRIIHAHCLGCRRWVWPWQGRCYDYHSTCKHAADARSAEANGIDRWPCRACGR